jgi:hypothetical protein
MRWSLRSVLFGALVLVIAAAPSGAAAGAKKTAGLSVKSYLTATTVNVTWKSVSGTVEVSVRVKSGGKTRTQRAKTNGRHKTLTVKLTGVGSAALPTSAVAVKARICKTAKGKRTCRPWSKSVHPTAAPASGTIPATGTTPVATPTPTAQSGDLPTVGGCTVLPADHAFNQDVSGLPVDPRSDAYLASIGTAGKVHPDFGAADLGQGPGGFGIPYRVVPENEPLVNTVFGDYADESDPGRYPVPLDTPVEGGPDSDGDRHVLVVQQGKCQLYEMGNAYPQSDGWHASGGAIWNLATGIRATGVHPGWTSVDAAGLPVLPGLVRYDEVAAGAIHHAIRFTVARTQKAYVAPASHWASSVTDQNVPPMGLRLRMRSDFDLSKFHGQSLVVATALKRYGMIVADNGSNWYLSGAADTRWDDDDLNQLKTIPGSAFEVVQTGAVVRP